MEEVPFNWTISHSIAGFAAVAGKKEGEGPFGNKFDMIFQDGLFGEKTFEKAESKMQKEAATRNPKSGLTPDQIQLVFAGDLLNQCGLQLRNTGFKNSLCRIVWSLFYHGGKFGIGKPFGGY